jgi:FtsZ-binding cell division protein ZapB
VIVDIYNYPIFEVGTWNGMKFTVADLDDIENNFRELASVQKVPLKFGHNDEQPLTDGQPALGWVQNLRRVGNQLLADFSDVPQLVKDLIRKNMYRSVSVELLLGLERGKKIYKHVLDAVALLGVDKPAVETLPDLSAYLASRSALGDSGRRVAFEVRAGNLKQVGGKRMSDEVTFTREQLDNAVKTAAEAMATPLRKEIEDLRTKNEELRKKFSDAEDKVIALESKVKRFEAEEETRKELLKKQSVKMARESATKVLDEAVKQEKITPAQREKALAMFGINDDERVVKLDLDDVKEYFSIKDAPPTKGGSRDNAVGDLPDGHGRVEKDPIREVDRRTRIQMSKNPKSSYWDSAKLVFAEDPDLHREYLNTAPTQRAAGGNS